MMVKDQIDPYEERAALSAKRPPTTPETMSDGPGMMLGVPHEDEADQAFDAEYRAKMVSSHRHALSLFEEVFRNSRDPGVRKLAGQMLPALQASGSREPLHRDARATRKAAR